MLVWIRNVYDKLNKRVKGMQANNANWNASTVTVTQVQDAATDLLAKSDILDAAEKAVKKARNDAKDAKKKYTLLLKQVDKLAEGFHANETSKLSDYNIALRKAKKAKLPPAKAIINSITDDTDGVGFIITLQPLADAEGFEVERSEGQQPDIEVLATPYPLLKITQKLTFKDDSVEKGKRYFYRIRAFNRRGHGPWSEPVSRVQ